jgi:DNA polymerase elongation subunit (family B)
MNKVQIDWDKVISKSIIDKVEHVFNALGWTMEEIKPKKERKKKHA